MNIIKFGGSIVNPDGKYDDKVINEFIELVRDSKDKFIFVVGGGKLCRKIQGVAKKFLKEALKDEKQVEYANDWLGIATTKINAGYVLQRFKEKLGEEVFPEVIIDPTHKITTECRVLFAGGWKPGCSTDKDMMLLAETFKAKKVIKISDFEVVKKIKPQEFAKLSDKEKKIALMGAEDISKITWDELQDLVGKEWIPGLNTPFDPRAAEIGVQLKDLTLYIGRKEQLEKMLSEEEFRGTVVNG